MKKKPYRVTFSYEFNPKNKFRYFDNWAKKYYKIGVFQNHIVLADDKHNARKRIYDIYKDSWEIVVVKIVKVEEI